MRWAVEWRPREGSATAFLQGGLAFPGIDKSVDLDSLPPPVRASRESAIAAEREYERALQAAEDVYDASLRLAGEACRTQDARR